MAADVAVSIGVGDRLGVGLADGLAVLVGVGVTDAEGAMMDRSGQVHPTVSVETSHSPTTAVRRPCKDLALLTWGSLAERVLRG